MEQARTQSESFMTLLKRLRLANGLTQTQLADKLDVVPSTVSFWEAGKWMPEPKQIPKLAKILGVSAFELTKFISPDPQPFTVGDGATA